MPGSVTMLDPHGVPHDIAADQIDAARMQGFTVEGDDQRAQRVGQEAVDERYSTPLAKVGAFAAGVNRAVTFGASDAIGTAIDPEQARHYRGLRDANPGLSTAGELAGTLITSIPTGGESIIARGVARTPGAAVSRLGARMAEAGEGASAISQIGHAVAGGAVEGALYGAGSGVSELALSEDPVSLERAVGTISSSALYGGGIGGAAGSLGKVAEIGLGKAKVALDTHLAQREMRTVTEDLAQMDVKALRAARETEIEALKTGHKAEIEAIEKTRTVEKQSIADDIKALRREVKDSEQWATTKDLKMPASAEGRLSSDELGAQAKRFDKQLQAMTDNPIELARNPTSALRTLRGQEHSLQTIIEHGDELRAAYAVDGLGGKRLAALETAPKLLEKNRELQARILEVSKPHAPVPTSSPRLEAIEAARDALAAGGQKGAIEKLPEQMLQGSVFGMVTGAVAPVAGPFAPLIGAALSKVITDKVFGRLGAATAEAATRTAKAVSKFLDPAAKVAHAAPPLATKVLSTVRFAPDREEAPTTARAPSSLANLYRKRSDEVKAQTEYTVAGTVEMRPDARAKIHERLKPVGAVAPQLADRLETIAARRIEFLASKLPRRPDMAGMPLGPDTWQPSDMEMRQWARYVAAAEDPTSVIERLSTGTVSPEDAEVMRAVYPEMLADLTRQIVEQLPTLQKTLPLQRQIALTILTGVPVNPATDPRILTVLQAQYAKEEGSAGGAMAPRAQPQFGSVAKSVPEPTPAQKRAG